LRSFFKAAVTGFVGAVVGAAVIVGTGGWGALTMEYLASHAGVAALAGAAGGAAAGATGAALNGGNFSTIAQGALMGAMMGGATGGLIGVVGSTWGVGAMQTAGYGMLGTGAVASYATGGLDGLSYFGAGLVGAWAGYSAVGYTARNWEKWFSTDNIGSDVSLEKRFALGPSGTGLKNIKTNSPYPTIKESFEDYTDYLYKTSDGFGGPEAGLHRPVLGQFGRVSGSPIPTGIKIGIKALETVLPLIVELGAGGVSRTIRLDPYVFESYPGRGPLPNQ